MTLEVELARIEIFSYSVTSEDLKWLTPLASAFLSADERDRWQRFRVAEPANVFLASRYLMRHLLAKRLMCSARHIELIAGEHGKPSVRVPASSWRFNLSHSRDFMVFALAEHLDLGIDVETVVTRKSLDGLAEQVLTPIEQAHFGNLGEAARQDFFTRAWVLKESYVKLLGKGVWHGLKELAVDVSAPGFLTDATENVRAVYLDVPPAFRAALCHQNQGVEPPELVLRSLHSLKELDG